MNDIQGLGNTEYTSPNLTVQSKTTENGIGSVWPKRL